MKNLLTILLLLSSNISFCQISDDNSIITCNIESFNYFSENPCISSNTKLLSKNNRKVNFLRFESCNSDNSKLKGFVYCVLLSNDSVYKIPKEELSIFNLNHENCLKQYKNLTINQKLSLERVNRLDNKIYYDSLKEEKRKIEELRIKRELEEQKKIELARKEKERIDRINKDFESAKNDSITELGLRKELDSYIEIGENNKKIFDSYIKKGKENGGILISKFDFATNEYGVVDLTMGIKNVGSKKIKYVVFKLLPLNSVNDPADEEKSFKGIGFINPNSDGEWEFESAWYSDIIETISLKSVSIIYEDGSTKTITNIGAIRIDENENILNGIDTYDEEKLFRFDPLIIFSFSPEKNDYLGIVFYSILSKEKITKIIESDDLKVIVADLKKSIENINNKVFETNGIFETKYYSQNIYMTLEGGVTLISLKNAELILQKLIELNK